MNSYILDSDGQVVFYCKPKVMKNKEKLAIIEKFQKEHHMTLFIVGSKDFARMLKSAERVILYHACLDGSLQGVDVLNHENISPGHYTYFAVLDKSVKNTGLIFLYGFI